MERLWTPWRMEYIRTATRGDGECFLCSEPAAAQDDRFFILSRATSAFACLNIYPYNPGHLLVAPFRHVADLEDVTPEESADCDGLLRRSVAVLKEAMEPHGFNLGMNLGRAAGAGVPGHIHWHVVPRWGGDTNFMPIVGETRVLPELLADTYAKLRPLF
ncbi:MAG TPA: HIT domain-containing protein [Actinomycetota bacterium]|nr:HIT domain-containing protein [Actinomycetota bacterium]